ncbi:Protein of unknown function, partial [Cotesia congregata]
TIIKTRVAPQTNPRIKFKPDLTKAQQNHLTSLRAELKSLHERGDKNKTINGGVFIAAKLALQADQIYLEEDILEQVFIKIKGIKNDLITGCIYIPPMSTIDIYEQHFNALIFIRNKYKETSFLIVGDYNLPSSQPSPVCTKFITESLALIECYQHNTVLNDTNTILDLCFSNLDPSINRASALTTEEKCHPALAVTIDYNLKLKLLSSPSYIYSKADYTELNNFFFNTNWTNLYQLDNLDDKLIPSDPITSLSGSQRSLFNLLNKKKNAHCEYKINKSYINYRRFSDLRRKSKLLGISCFNVYLGRVEKSIHQDTKKFWNFIKNKTHDNSNIPSAMSWNDFSAHTGPEISELFASFFKENHAPESIRTLS